MSQHQAAMLVQQRAFEGNAFTAGSIIEIAKARYVELQKRLDEVPAIRAELEVLTRLLAAAEAA
jgi:hypothetical protein